MSAEPVAKAAAVLLRDASAYDAGGAARTESRVHNWLLVGLLAWIVFGFAAQMDVVFHDTRVNSVDLLFDDAYYYLGVAWHLAHGHGSRFTEPLLTNGYHPLWLLLLTGITSALDLSKEGLFRAALVLTALIQCGGIYLFDFGQPSAWRRTAGRIGLFVAFIKWPMVFSYGMETTLFVLFIPWLLRVAKAPAWSHRHALKVGLLLALVFLTRLDALALDAAIVAVALLTRRTAFRGAVVTVAPLAVAIVIFAFVNQQVFGTPLPVSGQAKAIGSQFGANFGTTLEFFAALRWTIVMWTVWAVARLTVKSELRFEGFETVCLAIGMVACALYYGLLSGWPIWPWYLYPNAFLAAYATLFGVLGGRALLSFAVARLARRIPPSIVRGGATLLVGIFVATWLGKFVSGETLVRGHLSAYYLNKEIRRPESSSFNRQNVALIPWLERNYPRGAVIAMGDRAGGLGYWMPERFSMLQIEGLVADKAFLQTLRSGELEAYLTSQRTDLYIADRPAAPLVDGVFGFVEPVQPLVPNGTLNILCFREKEQLLAQDYEWVSNPQLRRVFDYNKRIACPVEIVARLQALKPRYRAIRSYSGF